MEKEFLYVGYYVDTNGSYILKIGTTNDLDRRRGEHNRNYRRAKTYTMPDGNSFEYLWHLKLSKWNTHRFEESNIDMLKNLNIGEYVRNDRFVLTEKPLFIPITIRKTYEISLA